MRIEGLKKYRGRNLRGYFQDLPWEIRQRAYAWLDKFLTRRKARFGHVPAWLFAIYVGKAKWLAQMSDDERRAWGYSMLAKRGGYAVQRRYRAEGRVGKRHPAHYAAAVSASTRRWKKTVKERERRGIEPRRHGFGNLQGV